MKHFNVVAIGENLIDLYQVSGQSAEELDLEGHVGGAPANVLVGLSKLGMRTSFITQLSFDRFGERIFDTLSNAGVDLSGSVRTNAFSTTLAIVALDDHGDRCFSFYRNGTADIMLDEKSVSDKVIDLCEIFHFGSVSMTNDPARTATLSAVKYARNQGKKISYDPNIRLQLWSDEKEARAVSLEGAMQADYIKLSEEEVCFLSETDNLKEGINILQRQNSDALIVVTRGKNGCLTFFKDTWVSSAAYDVNVIDTTGAGDAFWSTFLFQILSVDLSLNQVSVSEMQYMLDSANAAGSLTTSKKGAIPALPMREDIEQCINSTKRYPMNISFLYE